MSILKNLEKTFLFYDLESLLLQKNITDYPKILKIVEKLKEEGYISEKDAKFYPQQHIDRCRSLDNPKKVYDLDKGVFLLSAN